MFCKENGAEPGEFVALGHARFRNEGAFGEALAVQIRGEVAAALQLGAAAVTVTLTQKARGGITITATA